MKNARRDFFRQLARELARPIVAFKQGLEEGKPDSDRSGAPSDSWTRPPSVEDDDAFLRACDRSGECVKACPADAIFAFETDGSPYINPVEQPCVVCADLACMTACPSGALGPRERTALGMGTARVDHETCIRSDGQDCIECIRVCPLHEDGVKVLDIDPADRIRVRALTCVGCGVCQEVCPTDPKAIQVVPRRLLASNERRSE